MQSFKVGEHITFQAKFYPTGNILIFSTFLEGAASKSAVGLALDNAGNASVTGFTYSTNFRTANPIQETNAGTPDTFTAKLNSADIVSSQQFRVAPQVATSLITEGKRTDAVFGYATADSAPG